MNSTEAPMNPGSPIRMFALPKSGSSASEYEDAAALEEPVKNGDPLRASVADGATESVFAKQWAEVLAKGLVADAVETKEAWEDALRSWRREWLRLVEEQLDDLPWYAAAKVEDGAFATALGLTIRPDGTWAALSVGDCLLVHLSSRGERTAWPEDDPDAFGSRPTLACSRSDAPVSSPQVREGTWSTGDAFVLATDAVAAWLLRVGVRRVLDWDADAFESAVREARASGALRNDDCTLLVIPPVRTNR